MISVIEQNVIKEDNLYRFSFALDVGGPLRTFSFYISEENNDKMTEIINRTIADIQHEQEVAQNPLNQDVSSLLISTFQDTLLDVVQYVRNNPEITENDFLSWYNTEHPINVLGGDRLLNYAKLMLGMPSFDDLKNFIINQKFVGLDL